MIRKVNAGAGAQLLIINRATRLTRACWRGSRGPAQLSYMATEQIWIKTQCPTARTLSSLDDNGVEHSELFLSVCVESETTMRLSREDGWSGGNVKH